MTMTCQKLRFNMNKLSNLVTASFKKIIIKIRIGVLQQIVDCYLTFILFKYQANISIFKYQLLQCM